jgi:hypothetical protein
MSYNEREFYRLIKKANFLFDPNKSSLKPVIDTMNLPSQQQLSAMRLVIKQMPADKKKKYREALAYLERDYVGGWLGIPPPPTPSGLTLERKPGWRENRLFTDTVMVHCTRAKPESVMVNGIDPQCSTEWCIPDERKAFFKWNRFAFLWEWDRKDFPPKRCETFGFGSNGYIYIVRVPRGTTYMSQHGTLATQKEIAFPESIEPESIIGIFQYQTGDKDVPPRNPPRKKTDYTLSQLALKTPYSRITSWDGSEAVGSTTPSSGYVEQALGI